MRLNTIMWPDTAWETARGEWALAERFGVGDGWVYDHLHLNGRPVWHEAFTTLAAVAATTTTIGMGTMVTSPNFRHPAPTAKAALTLAGISGGRFTLGIGAGGPGVDSDATGGGAIETGARMQRFEEFVDDAHLLLTQREVHREGRFFTVDHLELGGGDAAPSIAIAATGQRGMTVAAAHADLWITQDVVPRPTGGAVASTGPTTGYTAIAQQLELLDEVCAREGRDAASLPRLAVLGYGDERPLDSVEAFRDCAGRYGELGIGTIAVLWPRGDDATDRLAVLEEVAAELAGRP